MYINLTKPNQTKRKLFVLWRLPNISKDTKMQIVGFDIVEVKPTFLIMVDFVFATSFKSKQQKHIRNKKNNLINLKNNNPHLCTIQS